MNARTPALLRPAELGMLLGSRLKAIRLQKGWTRNTLASRAGIAAASLKRFETTGKASLQLVLKAAYALGRLEEFGRLLHPPAASTIADLVRSVESGGRKRGRI